MNQGKYVFAQIFDFISHNEFLKCVSKYKGDYKSHGFTCWKQFLCMAFGQLSHRESLSDAIICINANSKKLYHLGIGRAFNKSTLSRANESRDFRIYQDFAMHLILQAKKLYVNDNQLEIDIKKNVFAIDTTYIEICLSIYPWAKYRTQEAAVKVHTMLDMKTSIPEFIYITHGKVHDIKFLDLLQFIPDSFYVMDRAYLSFDRLYKIDQVNAYFITRPRKNFNYKLIKSSQVDPTTGVLADETIKLITFRVKSKYPKQFRRITYKDPESQKELIFLTNNFELTALEITKLYKHRWYIELFFKWIKQHLKIKSFWGVSPNAVKTQIWIAISVYVMVLIVKKKLKLVQSIYEILQVLSINLLDKESINQLFSKTELQDVKEQKDNQLIMFNL